MKLIVINLEKSKDRLVKISKNFKKLNISFERFNAIYGKELDNDTIKDKTKLLARTILSSKSIIGCYLSHSEVWKQFMSSKDDFVIISEDDVEYNREFPKFIDNIKLIYKKVKFDILSVNCSVGIKSSFQDSIHIKDYEITKPIFPLTMASYVLSRKGVIKLVSLLKKVTYHIDFEIAWLNLFSKLEYYNVRNPQLLIVDKSNDTNTGSVGNGILNKLLTVFGADSINWFLNNSAITLNLTLTINIYQLLLIITIIICLVKRLYIATSILCFELILTYT